MKITAIAPWFGGKRRLAPRIVKQLGPHRCYWEPFCGSMAVLLEKPEVSQETVNDLHGDLINLARVIRHRHWGPWLYRQLRRCVASWLGRNGVIGTKGWNNNFCVRYTMNGGIQGTRFVSAVQSIPAWRRRMSEVTILRRDGFDLIEKIEDQDGVAIYLDPPYLTKGEEYVHDFASGDHDRLAAAARRFKRARIVVSYYDDRRLAVLYTGWNKINCTVAKSMAVQGKRGSKKQEAPEVLLVNGPVFGSGDEEGGLF